MNELAVGVEITVHDAQRVEVVDEVELVILHESHPVLVSGHIVLLGCVQHRRSSLDSRNQG